MSNGEHYIIRPIRRDETGLLKSFLYEAIFVPDGVEAPPRSVVDLPELALYVEGFGERRDDRCLVADCEGNVAGAVWARVMNDYGHIDDETPSLSIALYKPYRNRGIGTRLMTEMLALLSREGCRRASLSVQKANYAADMYLKLGFKIVKETEEEFVMVKDMEKEMSSYERFLAGEYCNRLDPEVMEMIVQTQAYLSALNGMVTTEQERKVVLSKMLGGIGKYSSIGRNFSCQCGKHIFIGEKTVVNDNCTMMDENHIRIGNCVLVAPHVQFYTASHPIDFGQRFVEEWNENSEDLFFRTKALPITVEDNVWIGGGSIVLAGVTIGKGSVIGAGSVVTKSIPANCVAAGNPCRVVRFLNPSYRTRPLTADDIPAMQRLVKETILGVNARDYTREEVADWASCLDDEARQRELLAAHGFIAALDETGQMVGIASMNAEGYLHSLFVHKDWQGRGVASFLLGEVERKAREYGAKEVYCEVSLTARPFFEKRGYVVEKVQKQQANRLLLTNFVMRKRL